MTQYNYEQDSFTDGAHELKSHGLPSSNALQDIMLHGRPVTDFRQAAGGLGLLGAGAGLGYTALQQARTGKNPSGFAVARNTLVGGGLGAVLGAILANDNRMRAASYSPSSYSDVTLPMNKASMDKAAIAPALLAIIYAASLYSAGQAAKSTGSALGSLSAGDTRAAKGHAASAAVNTLYALPAGKAVGTVGKGITSAGRAIATARTGAQTGQAVQRIGNTTKAVGDLATKGENLLFGPQNKGWFRNTLGLTRGLTAGAVGQSVADNLLSPQRIPPAMQQPSATPATPPTPTPAVAPTPTAQPPVKSQRMANWLRGFKTPAKPVYRTLL